MDQQPQQLSGGATHGASTLISNFGSDLMAGLSYLINLLYAFCGIGLILQIVIFFVEKNKFVKFHTAQVLLLNIVGAVLFAIIYGIEIAVLGAGAASTAVDTTGIFSAGAGLGATVVGCIGGLVGLAFLGLWIWGMVGAFQGKATKLPLIGNIAEAWAGGSVENIGL